MTTELHTALYKELLLSNKTSETLLEIVQDLVKALCENIECLPVRAGGGLYFLKKGEEIVYVGRSKNVFQRLFQGHSEKDYDEVFMLRGAQELESVFVQQLLPIHNVDFTKASSKHIDLISVKTGLEESKRKMRIIKECILRTSSEKTKNVFKVSVKSPVEKVYKKRGPKPKEKKELKQVSRLPVVFDAMELFINQKVTFDQKLFVTRKEFFESFSGWSQSQGYPPETASVVGKAVNHVLRDTIVVTRRQRKGSGRQHVYSGIGLT